LDYSGIRENEERVGKKRKRMRMGNGGERMKNK